MKRYKKETKRGARIAAGVSGVVMLTVLTSALLSTSALAAPATASLVVSRCSEVSRDIHQLMQSNPDSLCIGDLDVASAYVDAAESLLLRDKVWQAISSIEQGMYELSEISDNRAHCAPLAPRVKHILANLIRAKGEVEASERLKIMHQVTG